MTELLVLQLQLKEKIFLATGTKVTFYQNRDANLPLSSDKVKTLYAERISSNFFSTLFPMTYFDLVIAHGGGKENKELDIELLLTWNLAHIQSKLQTSKKKEKKKRKICWIQCDLCCWHHHMSAFWTGNVPFSCFC